MNKNLLRKINAFAVTGILIFTYSCRSNDTDHNLSENAMLQGISFNLINADFETDHNALQASVNNSGIAKALVNKQEIQSGPFNITAELASEISPVKIPTQASTVINSVADKLGSISNPVKYVVVVYKQDGTYLGQELGDASNPNQKMFGSLNLVGNQKYTFVTYSLGATTAPPAAPTTNLNVATLGLGIFTGGTSGSDLMFAINEDVLLTGGNTPLDVHLKHKFSKITISMDASDATGLYGQPNYIKGGYPLASESGAGATATISSFYTGCSVRFKNGNTTGIVTGGSPGTISVGGIKAAVGNEKVLIINTGSETGYKGTITLPTGAVVIGNDKNSAPVSINIDGTAGAGLEPGKAYTLKLKFNSDRYTDANNVTKANGDYVVIAGYRWDRYNVGVAAGEKISISNNYNPETPLNATYSAKQHGAKFQWGAKVNETNRYISQSADQVTSGSVPWLSTQVKTSDAWNLGTETTPIKNTFNDPCQTGYRVPTENEYSILNSATSFEQKGTWNNSPANYDARLTLTSKKGQYQITFPAAGYREEFDPGAGSLQERGLTVVYWSSRNWGVPNPQTGSAYYYFPDTGLAKGYWFEYNASHYVQRGAPVRCIQE
ncbi:hypothetical protein ATE49_04975 [Elizabethkingia miricola]|uniref:Fimbrillin family protein n=1 Tax=Elizabethkingia miricola TaxID=172045 RepID=A0ABY3NG24_ELIMR|nr:MULTISPECIES: hypothetical protein [Elizabethkingia]NHQ66997.1 hypothetical protein [Elizabethkingia miricola]NHQ72444.1 hypothetical protein [Elizabethkingia miricola]NHQ79162.1 hypothetical protein [Elizabethkingia miricola]OBS12576.1 hypothetical protein ATE49_04975 [Elizabethkingia miricola]PSL89032.1 hypothetical protein C7V10_06895 [Elizabethkingia miricola]